MNHNHLCVHKRKGIIRSIFITIILFNFSIRIFERIQRAHRDSDTTWNGFAKDGLGLFYIGPVEMSSDWRILGSAMYLVQRISSAGFWTLADWFPTTSALSMYSIVAHFSEIVSSDPTNISEVCIWGRFYEWY
jgi:hypothetical protein